MVQEKMKKLESLTSVWTDLFDARLTTDDIENYF
jgi:hypothetical protein